MSLGKPILHGNIFTHLNPNTVNENNTLSEMQGNCGEELQSKAWQIYPGSDRRVAGFEAVNPRFQLPIREYLLVD